MDPNSLLPEKMSEPYQGTFRINMLAKLDPNFYRQLHEGQAALIFPLAGNLSFADIPQSLIDLFISVSYGDGGSYVTYKAREGNVSLPFPMVSGWVIDYFDQTQHRRIRRCHNGFFWWSGKDLRHYSDEYRPALPQKCRELRVTTLHILGTKSA